MVESLDRKVILVGTYMNAQQEALQVLSLEPDGQLRQLNQVTGIDSPSYLALTNDKHYLYAVSEVEDGAVVSYSFNAQTGDLKELNRQLTQGAMPCFVSIDNHEKKLFVANYMGGSVCAYPIEADGSIGALADRVKHSSHSIHGGRQEAAHPHAIVTVPGTNERLVTDLGTDHLYIYRNETPNSSWVLHDEIDAVPGSGPRHIAFHPNKPFIYVIQELNSTIALYHRDEAGHFTLIETVSTLPKGFQDENTAAHIQVSANGDYLYASNRGHDSIVSYRIGEKGTLDCIGYTSTLGKTPRHFLLVHESSYMLVANQDSDSIIVMSISQEGLPVSTGLSYAIESPVCLVEA